MIEQKYFFAVEIISSSPAPDSFYEDYTSTTVIACLGTATEAAARCLPLLKKPSWHFYHHDGEFRYKVHCVAMDGSEVMGMDTIVVNEIKKLLEIEKAYLSLAEAIEIAKEEDWEYIDNCRRIELELAARVTLREDADGKAETDVRDLALLDSRIDYEIFYRVYEPKVVANRLMAVANYGTTVSYCKPIKQLQPGLWQIKLSNDYLMPFETARIAKMQFDPLAEYWRLCD